MEFKGHPLKHWSLTLEKLRGLFCPYFTFVGFMPGDRTLSAWLFIVKHPGFEELPKGTSASRDIKEGRVGGNGRGQECRTEMK